MSQSQISPIQTWWLVPSDRQTCRRIQAPTGPYAVCQRQIRQSEREAGGNPERSRYSEKALQQKGISPRGKSYAIHEHVRSYHSSRHRQGAQRKRAGAHNRVHHSRQARRDKRRHERRTAKRTITFVRPHGMDDYDLLHAPAREKDRQHYSAIAERNETIAGEPAASPVRTGDELAAQGKADEALAAYCQQIAFCTTQLADTANDHAASREHSRAVARIGLLADQLVFAGNFVAALKCADEAIVRSAETNLTWIQLIRAHANMFLGSSGEARDFYLSFWSDKNVTFTSWETVILWDFRRLQNAGHSHPLMVEVEKKLADAGWTAQGRRADKTGTPAINADDQQFIMLNPDHVQTGALLAEQGKLDEAADVYWRNLAKCEARLAKEPLHAETIAASGLLIVRLGVLAETLSIAVGLRRRWSTRKA